MINLAVINIKDILKILKRIIFIILLCIFVVNFFGKIEFNMDYIKNKFGFNNKIIDDNVLISNYYNNNSCKSESGLKKILVSEFALFSTEEELMEKENQEEVLEFESESSKTGNKNINNENKVETNEISIAQATENMNSVKPIAETKVIKENNKTDNYTNIYKSVKIKNESSYNLTEDMLLPNVDLQNKNDIIIYHTHTCESYTPTEANNYVASGNYRTIDLNYSVARVGTELTNNLLSLGFNVNHNTTYHDYPAYTGSYSRSLATIKEILSKNSAEFIIDLHRDAIGSMSNYAPSVQIGEDVGAQLMFVIGTDGGGLEHKDWLYNFKMAVKIQEKANEMYPGLFKPIILRNSRYNQHVSKGACIIEVGATGNTLEQCNVSMKYLAKVIEEVMK